MLAGFYLAITVSVIRKRLTGSKTHSSSNQRRSQKGGSSRGQWFRGTLSQMITALKIPHELCPIISRLWHFFLVSQLFLFFFAMARTPSAGPNVANEVEVNLLKHWHCNCSRRSSSQVSTWVEELSMQIVSHVYMYICMDLGPGQ